MNVVNMTSKNVDAFAASFPTWRTDTSIHFKF
jgi:hypothetical protein